VVFSRLIANLTMPAIHRFLSFVAVAGGVLASISTCYGQAITHQIALPSGMSWCEDSMINGLFAQINQFRSEQGAPSLGPDALGNKDAEMRAVQFASYMATHFPGSPGFNPHLGYDTTAASLGYNLVSENLAYITSDPIYIVYGLWQDTLHRAALLSGTANIAGVSCVYSSGTPYWSYEPGIGQAVISTPPGGGSTSLDTEESTFLTLINAYRAQNGAGPLQVSPTLEKASTWMSNDMATKNYVSHTDSLWRDPATRLAAFGYTSSPWGENIAAGYSDAQTTLNQLISACDPDGTGSCTYAHRRNMLNPGFTAIGIGRVFYSDSSYKWYWTTDFGGVLDGSAQASLPVIASFVSSPATISAGQTARLTWNVSGAATVRIDNGVGDVTGVNSFSVSPNQNTTYTLTAANSTGSITATAAVIVNTGGGSGSSVAAPVITSIVASGPNQVNVSWSEKNAAGIAGYQITRNGSPVISLPAAALSWGDTTVSPATTYIYSVKAFDSAGNYSAASNSAQVATPAGSSASGCPNPGANVFVGCYYNNVNLTGSPVLVNNAGSISFNWGWGFPNPPVPQENFSVRWQGQFSFNQGQYSFKAVAADGMRVYIDSALVFNAWYDQPAASYSFGQLMTAGTHLVTVEYYDHTNLAVARLSWNPM
jgi:uncharacterized protein YkwD